MSQAREVTSFVLVVSWLSLGMACSAAAGEACKTETGSSTVEPRAPEILALKQVGELDAQGIATIEASITPGLDGPVELEVVAPAGLKFETGSQKKGLTLRRGDPVRRERIKVGLGDGKRKQVRVRLSALTEDGAPWMIIERDLEFNRPPEDPSAVLVPVVHALPDGRRIIERVPQTPGGGSPGIAASGVGMPVPRESTPTPLSTDAGGDLADSVLQQ